MKNFKSTTIEKDKDLAQTPDWFIYSLQSFIGKYFTLDVCALPSTAKLNRFYSLANGTNGLKLGWLDFNWCNPPFSNIPAWIEKAVLEAELGNQSCILMPDNAETVYCRMAFEKADTIIKMPFRIQFLRPDGTPFLDKNGKIQGPQFACQVALFTKIGLVAPTRVVYHDFRIGFKHKHKRGLSEKL